MKYFSLQTNQLVKVLLVFFVAFGITNTLFAQALTGIKLLEPERIILQLQQQ